MKERSDALPRQGPLERALLRWHGVAVGYVIVNCYRSLLRSFMGIFRLSKGIYGLFMGLLGLFSRLFRVLWEISVRAYAHAQLYIQSVALFLLAITR